MSITMITETPSYRTSNSLRQAGTAGLACALLLVATSGCATMKKAEYLEARPISPHQMPVAVDGAPLELTTPTAAAKGVEGEVAAGPADSEVNRAINAPAVNLSQQIIYTATLRLVVADAAVTQNKLKLLAEKAGGYMQALTGDAIVLRVPAPRFQEYLDATAKLGTLTGQEIKADNVTEEMLDLNIRLKNQEDMRNRLAKLIEQGGKVEELLKIEQELNRVTENLERLKGRIQYLRSAVAYCTITVKINTPAPLAAEQEREYIPFAWVECLGAEGFIAPVGVEYTPTSLPSFWNRWLKYELPAGYITVAYTGEAIRAVSGNGVAVLIERQENFKGGNPEFWLPVIRRHLAAGKTIAIATEKTLELKTGAKAAVLSGSRVMARTPYSYVIGFVVTAKTVYTVEIWGNAEDVTRDRPALEDMLRSLSIKP